MDTDIVEPLVSVSEIIVPEHLQQTLDGDLNDDGHDLVEPLLPMHTSSDFDTSHEDDDWPEQEIHTKWDKAKDITSAIGDRLTPVYDKLMFLLSPIWYVFWWIGNWYPLAKLRIYLRNSDVVVFLVLMVINMIIWFSICGTRCWSDPKSFGKRTGTLIQWNFMLVIIPITRSSALFYIPGVSFENVILFHRWIGRWIFAITSAHGIAYTIYYHDKRGWHGVYKEFFTKFTILSGVLSFVFITILLLTSFPIFRRKCYDFFMKIHYVAFFLCFLFALLHKKKSQFIYLTMVPLGLYVLDLGIRFMFFMFSSHTVSSMQMIGDNYVRLNLRNYTRYKPGQYVFLYIPAISWFEMHPYSIISSPIQSQTASVFIEVQGRWTKRVKKSLMLGKNPIRTVWVDGPYGAISIPSFTELPFLVFVAGGIGIAPIIGLLKEIHLNPKQRSTRVHVIWSCRERDLFDEFATEMSGIIDNPESNCSTSLQLYHTGGEEGDVPLENLSHEFYQHFRAGKPDFKDIFNDIVDDADKLNTKKAGVFVCGSRRLRNVVLRNTYPRRKCLFTVHTESFTL